MIDKLKLVNWLRHQHNIIDNCKQTTMTGNRMELAAQLDMLNLILESVLEDDFEEEP